MPLVSGNIPNFINGVSQQAPSLRLESQGAEQINGLSDVVGGLTKRPPTQQKNKLKTTDPLGSTYLSAVDIAKAYIHTYQRSATEQYTVFVVPSATTPKIYTYDVDGNLRYESGVASWDAAGTQINTNTDDTSYLITADGLANFDTTSIADRTYLVNKSVTVAQDTITIDPPARPYEGLVFLKQGDYEREHRVLLTATDGSEDDHTILYTSGNDTLATNAATGTIVGGMRADAESGAIGARQIFETKTSSVNRTTDKIFTVDPSVYPTAGDTLQITVGGGTISSSDYTLLGTNQIRIDSDNLFYIYRRGKSLSTRRRRVEFTNLTTSSAFTDVYSIYPTTYTNEPMFVVSTNDRDFAMQVTDDSGGQFLRGFKDTAKSFTDLPNQAPAGFTLRVIGDNNKDEDDFYVKFEGDLGSGTWEETAQAGGLHFWDATTMPHSLAQAGDLSFGFAPLEWSSRKAGDDLTNPFPSILDNKINAVFFHRNRLGLLSGENIIFSEAGEYENFFRTTVRTLLDADPIDVAVSQAEVADLRAAIPFQEDLIIFSELNQFTLSSDTLLTALDITLTLSASYRNNLTANPTLAGDSLFFAETNGEYSGIRDYRVSGDAKLVSAPSVTDHVPEYVEGKVLQMTATANEDILLIRTDKDLKTVYVYSWYDQGQERLQSAWSKWVFDQDVANVYINNTGIYVTFASGSLEFLELTPPSASKFIQDAFLKTPVVLTDQWYIEDNNPASAFGYILDERGAGVNLSTNVDYGSVNNTVFSSTSDHIKYIFVRKYEYYSFGVLQSTTAHVHVLTNGVANPYRSVTINGLELLTENSVALGTTENQWEITGAQSDTLFPTVGVNEPVTFKYITEAKELPDRLFSPLLDHRVDLTSAITTTSGITDAMDVTTATQFISHRGELLGVGTSALQDVVDHLALTHLEDGVEVDNYAFAGEPYLFSYTLSKRTHKEADGKPTQLSRFQLGSISFLTSDTAEYTVTVESTGRDPVTAKYTPRYIGKENNIIGLASIPEEDVYKVGLQSQAKETAITISNDSHLPCTFQSAEWEGYITLRAQRIQ